MKKYLLLHSTFVLVFLCSCATPQVGYFSDLAHGQVSKASKVLDIRLQTDDKVSIVVKSKDPLLSELFNLPVTASRIGYTTSATGNYNYTGQMSLYTIDQSGEIDFPVIGKIKIAGMKREEAAAHIKQQLISKNMVQDPVVTVEYGNLGFNILGEVNRPGRYTFDRDRLTLLDAISLAGDLTIQGQRENVTITRETTDGQHVTYKVNLRSAEDLYASPAFYLQQNDVIYIEPNEYRARQTTVNGNNVRSTTFWISLASLLTSVAVLLFK